MSYVNVLKENGYKDFTKYNINVNTGSAYLIVNKNRDIVDIENNSIQMSHDSKDYDMIVDNWPKKINTLPLPFFFIKYTKHI